MTQRTYWVDARMSRRRLLRGGAAGAAGLAGAALIGCGGGGTPTPKATGTAVTDTSRGQATAAVPARAVRGGTLRIAGQLGGDVPSLDYDRTNASAMGSITNNAGMKPVQWDERPDSNKPVEDVLPDLAESWETPDKGLTWTFKLRKNAKTAEGLDVKASDVVWSLERNAVMRQPQGLLESNLRDLYTGKKPNTTAIDDYTLQIKIAKPDADFLALMGGHWWTVEHKDVITKKGTDAGTTAPGWGDIKGVDQIRGGGPYYPTEYVPASGFKMKRNPNYWDKELAYVENIDHPLVLDPSAATAQLQSGQLDASVR